MNPLDADLNLSHAADFYNRYPGEVLNLNTRLQIGGAGRKAKLEKASLWVSLPGDCELIDFQIADETAVLSSGVRSIDGEHAVWQLAPLPADGKPREFVTRLRVLRPEYTHPVSSSAVLRDADGHELAGETTRVMLKLEGEYIRYLPEIYGSDDLMIRFLMLFESFWKPIDRQVRQVEGYFDPGLTPAQFLPWLASWVGACQDETLPEARRRQMLRMAASLYQRRGTHGALQEFLEIFSDGEVRITERPAANLVLGSTARLSYKTALGRDNSPDTFSVDMKIYRERFELPGSLTNAQVSEMMHKKILALIDAQKPAHTTCKLTLQVAETHG